MLMDNHNHAFTYDGEARIKNVDGTAATYTYNALGNRVRKDVGATSTEYFFFNGNVISELNPATRAYTDYIFGYGKRIAKDTSTNGTAAQYYHDDQIGSARVMTDAAANKISDCTFNPFGEQVVCSPDNASNHYRFTGKERDNESQLDDFGARYYSSSMGRWLTPDWSGRPTAVPYANFGDPQSLNLYLYVRNDPVSNADADGHVSHGEGSELCMLGIPGGCLIHPDIFGQGPNGQDDFGPMCHTCMDFPMKLLNWLLPGNPISTTYFNDQKTTPPPPPPSTTNGQNAQSTPANPNQQNQEPNKKKTSTNQMDRQVKKGQAPKSVDRVDSPRIPHEKPHVEFKDGNALNDDGTWKHGGRQLTNEEKEWLQSNGWSLPKQ
jgi:RHS repeat-associated protein